MQTPLIIIKSCHSPDRDLWAHRNRERVSELKNQKHARMWCILSEPVGMSIIIINSRVFSAKNPTVNDASGVTMLFAEAGMIFGVPQNNNSVLHDSYMFMFKWWTQSSFSVSGNVKPGVDPERSDYRTLRAERGTCFNPLQALITPPSTDWIHLVFPSFKTYSSWNQDMYNTIWEMQAYLRS